MSKLFKFIWLILPITILTINNSITLTNGARILCLFAHPAESHFAVMQTIVLELAKREHNVTVYSSHRMHEHIKNIEEYIIEPEYPFWREGRILTNGARILCLFAHPAESHFAVMQTIVLELAKREHNVTVYSSHRMHEHIKNIEEYIIEPEYPFWREVHKVAGLKVDATNGGGLQQLSQLPPATLQKYLGTVGAQSTDYFLSHKALQNLLKIDLKSFNYDLIITDLFYTEALLAFGHFFNTSVVGIVSTNFENYMQHTLESLLPIACSPIDFETYNPATAGYWQRLSNTRDCMTRRKNFAKFNFAAQELLIQKHFKDLQAPFLSPTIPSLQAELAILLLNNHVPLTIPRPLLPNTIAAGGLHIRQARELPWQLRRFIDESHSGVIYINLGNEQLCGDLSKARLEFFFKVLGQRDQRVLWTCHDVDKFENAPKNFMFQHIVPQADILAHPHVRVFVMNGDLLSLQEGIVRHVPMIGLPIFSDELRNMKLAQDLGVGLHIPEHNLTASALNWAVDTLLFDASYAYNIRRIATEFRDRPLGALETAIYWMDYVLRHNGGAQLKTKGIGIPSNQLHLFDLFIFYFFMAVLGVGALIGVYFIGLWLWRKRQIEKLYSKLN